MLTVDQIRGARGLLDWSQSDLAERAGLSQTGIARIENGTNRPNTKTLNKILRAFSEGGVEFIGERGVQKKVTEIMTYVGKTGFTDFLDDVYKTMSEAGGEFCVFHGDPKEWLKYSAPEFDKLHSKRMLDLKNSRNIHGKVITKAGETQIPALEYIDYRRSSKEDYQTNKSIYVYGDKIAFIDFQEASLIITVMKKREFSKGFRRMFDYAWESSVPLT